MAEQVKLLLIRRGTAERVFLREFRGHLSRSENQRRIFDPTLRKLLAESEQDQTQYSEALDRVAGQVMAARETLLFYGRAPSTDPAPAAPSALAQCYQVGVPEGTQDIGESWGRLASDAGYLALSLVNAREPVQRQSGETLKRTRRVFASQAVLALRLMVQALLYEQRARIDEQVTATLVMEDAFQRPDAVVAVFVRWIACYDAQVRAWNLRRDLLPGWKEAGDATSYSSWSRDFGRPRDAEIGWSPYARAVGSALRFQSHRMELRQLWSEAWRGKRGLLTPVALLGAAALWAFGLTTGFGLKPSRFAGTALLTIVTFSLAYFADAVASRCASQMWSLADYPRNIYYAIANLTGVGALPGSCVRDAGAIISAESLMGYFLLSVLAAMLFAWLTDR